MGQIVCVDANTGVYRMYDSDDCTGEVESELWASDSIPEWTLTDAVCDQAKPCEEDKSQMGSHDIITRPFTVFDDRRRLLSEQENLSQKVNSLSVVLIAALTLAVAML